MTYIPCGASSFDASGPALRRSAVAGLILAMAVPVPLVTVSGLSIPLPAFVERVAVELAATVSSAKAQHQDLAVQRVTITRTLKEQGLTDRASAAVGSQPTVAPAWASARLVAHRVVVPKKARTADEAPPSIHVSAPSQKKAIVPAAADQAVPTAPPTDTPSDAIPAPANGASPRPSAPTVDKVPPGKVDQPVDNVPPGQADVPPGRAENVPPGRAENVPPGRAENVPPGQGGGNGKVKP